MSAAAKRFRWVAPDGRKGRWRNSAVGSCMSAVSTRFSSQEDRVRVSFDAEVSVALWPELKAEGWSLEAER